MNSNDITKLVSYLKKGKNILNETKSTLTVFYDRDVVKFYDFTKKIDIKETGQTLIYCEIEIITDNGKEVNNQKSKYIEGKFRKVFTSGYIVVGFAKGTELKLDGIISNEIFYTNKTTVIETALDKINKRVK